MGVFGKNKNKGGDGGHSAGRVWCRICGRPVRSKLGEVCNSPECHRRYLGRSGSLDKFGE